MRAKDILGANAFSPETVKKYEIIKTNFPDSDACRKKAKELRSRGYDVATKKVGFSDLARCDRWFLTAIRPRQEAL